MKKAKEIHLISRPTGLPTSSNFKEVEVTLPEIKDGEVLVENRFLTVDPYMRGRMNDTGSYIPPFALNEAMTGGAVGEVVESRDSDFKKGDIILSDKGWRDSWVGPANGVIKIDPSLGLSPSLWLGALGMPGLTAYAGLFRIGEHQRGDTVFVSGAAGAVGSLVGQLAKASGSKVIASAGSDEKVDWLKNDLNFDHVFNYKNVELNKVLHTYAPKGIDVYFDNVGGKHLEAALNYLNVNGRVVMCGAISQYNETSKKSGPYNITLAIIKRLTLRGFIVSDHYDLQEEFSKKMAGWLKEGSISAKETFFEGLSQTTDAFLGLFSGKNTGKMVIRI